MKTIYLFAFCCLFLMSCEKDERDFYDGFGKRPMYIPDSELHDIRNEAPKPIEQSGTIFLRDTLLFLLDYGKGIHVYDISDTLNTIDLAFFKIPAVTDFVVNGNELYADSWRDLVVIDISNLLQIRETGRVKDVINPALYPPLYNGPFECIDELKGAVVGWEDALLEEAKCWTN